MSEFVFEKDVKTDFIPFPGGNGNRLKAIVRDLPDGTQSLKAVVLFTVTLSPETSLIISADVKGDLIQTMGDTNGNKNVYAMLLVDTLAVEDDQEMLECLTNFVIPTMMSGKVLEFGSNEWYANIIDIQWNVFSDWDPEQVKDYITCQSRIFYDDETLNLNKISQAVSDLQDAVSAASADLSGEITPQAV